MNELPVQRLLKLADGFSLVWWGTWAGEARFALIRISAQRRGKMRLSSALVRT